MYRAGYRQTRHNLSSQESCAVKNPKLSRRSFACLRDCGASKHRLRSSSRDADELQEYVCAKCREKEANGTAEGNTEPEGMPITVLLQLQSYIKLCRTFQLSFVVCGFSHLRRVFQNLSSVPTAFAALS
eukprot:8449633-Pyramimonas_sp.AAC.1